MTSRKHRTESIQLIGDTFSQHEQIIFGIERVFVTLHHADQHRLGNPRLAVCLPVHVEIAESGASEHTNLAVERFELLMNIADVLLQRHRRVEVFLTLITLLCLLPDSVPPLDMFSEVLPAPEHGLTVPADELLVGVVPLEVEDQVPLAVEDLAALDTEVILGCVLVNLPPVVLQSSPALETLPADLAGQSIDMTAVDLHRVVLQGSVAEEVLSAGGADVLGDSDSADDVLVDLIVSLLRVGVLEVGQEEQRVLVVDLSAERTPSHPGLEGSGKEEAVLPTGVLDHVQLVVEPLGTLWAEIVLLGIFPLVDFGRSSSLCLTSVIVRRFNMFGG